MHICPSVLLCSSSLVHTSLLSLQLAALLSELVCVCTYVCLRVCVCGQAHYGLNPNQPGILSACLRGSGVALAASQGHVSLSKRCLRVHPRIIPAARHPRLGLLVEAPLGMPGTLGSIYVCVLERFTLTHCVCMCVSCCSQFLDNSLILL